MLAEATARLERHFSALYRERAVLRYPVYALEHGIEPAEVDVLRDMLSRELAQAELLNGDHWITWVVVAAEVGYAYDGDEYWNSFARAVPDWRRFGNRETVRAWFRRFANAFGGFNPHGRWAEHFSIIAWPIAHAILPKDLQGQFARHLYDLRYELAYNPDLTLTDIGARLRSRDSGGSSRFQNLLEQTELTSRLVLALRDEDVQDAVATIYPPTLSRIVADLERRRLARDWLREARNVMRDARLRLSGGLVVQPKTSDKPDSERAQRPAGAKLVARRSSQGAWTLGVALPDLFAALRSAGLSPKLLDQSRVRFADTPDSWMPGRAMWAPSSREHPIASLTPFVGAPVFHFERDIPGLSAIVSDACRIAGSAPWILRICEDGTARQVLGNHVRAGQSYIMVTETPVTSEAAGALNLRRQESRTAGATLYGFDVPRVLSAQFLEALAVLSIGYTLRAVVEPIGLVPRRDEIAGSTVWLASEEPLLRLSADRPVKEFLVCIDGRDWARVPVDHSEAIISLGFLPIGPHMIDVRVTSEGHQRANESQRVESERFYIEIRPPTPWLQNIGSKTGFRADLEPAHASLEALLNGTARISLAGPPERQLSVEARTFDINGHPSGRTEIGRVTLPTENIRHVVSKLTKEPLSEEVQSSPRVDLVFVGDELGVSSLEFLQKVRPLRWKLETDESGPRARLVDEAGSGQAIEVDRYDITTPDQRIVADLEECIVGLSINPPGTLLAAKFRGKRYSVLVSLPERERMRSLAELGFTISFSTASNTPGRIPRLAALHRLWSNARPLGTLATVRKATVLEALEHQMSVLVCGQIWATRARECLLGRRVLLDRLQRDVGGSPGFASRMRTTNWGHAFNDAAARNEFVRLAMTYQITTDAELCVLAMQLAFSPNSVKFDDLEKGALAFERLAQVPSLARGAFLARLATHLAAGKVLAENAT